jgi:hypothetical protein
VLQFFPSSSDWVRPICVCAWQKKNEMAIQFGYLALFSPVYPLAAFLALLNNILEIRVDAAKLCYATRRPTWTGAADIGSWYTVMNVLGEPLDT